MALPNCPSPGEISVGLSNELLCLDAATSSPVTWENHVPAADFDPSMIDALAASEAFGAGFAIYAMFWALTAGVVMAVRAFRNL